MSGARPSGTGSRASTEPCSTVSALTGFDPARVVEIAEQLTPKQRAALRPCAADRACLKKAGLAGWRKPNPLHRLPSLKLTGLGYVVRDYLGLTEPVAESETPNPISRTPKGGEA